MLEESRESEDLKPASPAGLAGRIPEKACWGWGLEQQDEWEGRLEGQIYEI